MTDEAEGAPSRLELFRMIGGHGGRQRHVHGHGFARPRPGGVGRVQGAGEAGQGAAGSLGADPRLGLARVARRLLELHQRDVDDVAALVDDFDLLSHGSLLEGMGCRRKARLQPCPSARPGVQTSSGFAGNRLQGSKPCGPVGPAQPEAGRKPLDVRQGRRPKNGRAPARRENEGCKEPGSPGGTRRRAAGGAAGARRGGPVGAAQRRDRARPTAAHRIR